jgi:glycoside/pentoside/hexuronide:cation symporter, GPH family
MNYISHKLSITEKIGYSLGDLAANLVFQTLMTYLAYFYTDIYGLSSTDATAIMFIVGTVAAFGFNPIIGALADRTNSKWGKFRPWILYTSIPLGIITVMAFSTPNFSYEGKVVYAVITYSLLLLLYASSNLPYSALSGVITGNMKERNSISSYRFVAVMFAQFFVQVFMLPIIIYAGAGDKAIGIEIVMTWLAVILTIMLLITFFTTKERIVPTEEQKSSLYEDLQDLITNRPWLIMLILTTLTFISLAMKGGSYIYYFENYIDQHQLTIFIQPILDFLSTIGVDFFDDDPVYAGFGLFNAGGIIFMIIGIGFSKSLADKFGKRNIFGLFLFIATLFVLIFNYFEKTSVELMFISQMLHGFFYGITIPLLWAMIADVADYSEWKNNRRATAIIFSAMMVGLKLGLTIGGALIVKILDVYGYIAFVYKDSPFTGYSLSIPNTEQLPSVIDGVRLLVSIFPSIPFLIGILLLFFYKINKNMETQIEIDLRERRLN